MGWISIVKVNIWLNQVNFTPNYLFFNTVQPIAIFNAEALKSNEALVPTSYNASREWQKRFRVKKTHLTTSNFPLIFVLSSHELKIEKMPIFFRIIEHMHFKSLSPFHLPCQFFFLFFLRAFVPRSQNASFLILTEKEASCSPKPQGWENEVGIC